MGTTRATTNSAMDDNIPDSEKIDIWIASSILLYSPIVNVLTREWLAIRLRKIYLNLHATNNKSGKADQFLGEASVETLIERSTFVGPRTNIDWTTEPAGWHFHVMKVETVVWKRENYCVAIFTTYDESTNHSHAAKRRRNLDLSTATFDAMGSQNPVPRAFPSFSH